MLGKSIVATCDKKPFWCLNFVITQKKKIIIENIRLLDQKEFYISQSDDDEKTYEMILSLLLNLINEKNNIKCKKEEK